MFSKFLAFCDQELSVKNFWYNKRMEIPIKNEEKFKVKCNTCRKEVEVAIKPFGGGHVGICPECGKSAYNSKEKPKNQR